MPHSAATTHENELSAPVDLCAPDGRLNPAARGWSRRPLHSCNLSGRPGRKKRWDYWCVTSPEGAFQLTYADVDYLGLASAAWLDFKEKTLLEKGAALPLAAGFSHPDTAGGGPMRFRGQGLELSIEPEADGVFLRAAFHKFGGKSLCAEVHVQEPKGHETLNVVIPWDERRFQFTSKQNTLPATGFVEVGGRRFEFSAANGSFACLDYGRGIWPYQTNWNWASASGVQGGRIVGLQFGGKWTQGTGFTENGLCVDGRLSKIGEELFFEYDPTNFRKPWRIFAPKSRCVDLSFEPFFERSVKVPLLVAGAEVHVCFGRFSGVIVPAFGEEIQIRDLIGWAEEMRARW